MRLGAVVVVTRPLSGGTTGEQKVQALNGVLHTTEGDKSEKHTGKGKLVTFQAGATVHAQPACALTGAARKHASHSRAAQSPPRAQRSDRRACPAVPGLPVCRPGKFRLQQCTVSQRASLRLLLKDAHKFFTWLDVHVLVYQACLAVIQLRASQAGQIRVATSTASMRAWATCAPV